MNDKNEPKTEERKQNEKETGKIKNILRRNNDEMNEAKKKEEKEEEKVAIFTMVKMCVCVCVCFNY